MNKSKIQRKIVIAFCFSFLLQIPFISTSQAAFGNSQAKSIIRTLYYDITQAYEISIYEGYKYVVSRSYPGSLNSKLSLKCAKDYTEGFSLVPDLSTVAKDTSWKIRYKNQDTNQNLYNKKLPGDIYVVTVTYQSIDAQGNVISSKKSDNHVSILKGKAYVFWPMCE
jgi:hypothetical protein